MQHAVDENAPRAGRVRRAQQARRDAGEEARAAAGERGGLPIRMIVWPKAMLVNSARIASVPPARGQRVNISNGAMVAPERATERPISARASTEWRQSQVAQISSATICTMRVAARRRLVSALASRTR